MCDVARKGGGISLQEELVVAISAIREHLGVGSNEFMECQDKIIKHINGFMARGRRKKVMNKKYRTAAEISKVACLAQGKSYQLIREMFVKAESLLIIPGKVLTVCFMKKYYDLNRAE